MAKQQGAVQQLTEVVQALQRDVSRSIAASELEVERFGLQIGLQVQFKAGVVHWEICAPTKTAQHYVQLQVPLVETAWRAEQELSKLAESNALTVLGGASESEQLEHTLRLELEKLEEDLEAEAPKAKAPKAKAAKNKTAAKVRSKGKTKIKPKTKPKTKTKTKAKAQKKAGKKRVVKS